jgi:parvulin-like peptidyl-prolyl isomerase
VLFRSATSTPSVTETPSATATITLTPTPYTKQGYENQVATVAANLKSVGYSKTDLRNLIRRQLLREKVLEAVTKDVAASAEMVWARHILVEKEEDALKIVDELKAGASFAELAKQDSTDDSNKDQGGDLGWLPRGQMATEFDNAAFTLAVGEISQPVKTTSGYHIIQVLGHETRPLDEYAFQQAKEKAFTEWLDNAKKELNTQTYDTWTSVVPTEPTIPANMQTLLKQLEAQQQQQQQQQLQQQMLTPEPAAEQATPAP